MAPGTKGLGFFESWVGLFLNLGLWFAPDTRRYIAKKTGPSHKWEVDEDKERRVVWDAAIKHDHITVMGVVDKKPKLLHTSHLGRMLIHQAATFDQVYATGHYFIPEPRSNLRPPQQCSRGRSSHLLYPISSR
jgi:hypothetical protein